MALPVGALGVAAALEAAAVLNAAREVYFGGGAQYIRDGVAIGSIPAIGLAVARQTCRRYADNQTDIAPDTAANYEKACRPYLDSIGYGDGPSLLKPFSGGQCDAKYVLSYAGTTSNGARSYNARVLTWGPVGGARSVDRGDGRFDVEFLSSGSLIPTLDCNQNPAKGAYQWRVGTSSAGIAGPDDGGSFSIVTACAGSDNCGNPPPDYTEPVPPPSPGPPTEPFNPDPDTNIDITVNIQPDSLIEVNFGLGPIVVPIFGGGGDGGGGEPTDPTTDPDTSPPAPEPGPELPGGNGGFGGDDNFGEPPAGRRWVGCCIRITNTPANASVIATSEPEDVYPTVVGNIRLVFNAAGNRQTDTPVRILAKHVCVWEPVQKLNPVGVSVDLLPGYGYTFRPYSVPSGD